MVILRIQICQRFVSKHKRSLDTEMAEPSMNIDNGTLKTDLTFFLHIFIQEGKLLFTYIADRVGTPYSNNEVWFIPYII
jgi:hypothetical protein